MPEADGESADYEVGKQDGGLCRSEIDHVAREEPLQITVDGSPVAVVMRTPGSDEDLVRGFLITEGIIGAMNWVSRIDLEQRKNHAYVFLVDDIVLDREDDGGYMVGCHGRLGCC